MALYIPHSIFHLARLLYVRPEMFGPYYVYYIQKRFLKKKTCALYKTMWKKDGTVGQATENNMAHEHCMLDT